MNEGIRLFFANNANLINEERWEEFYKQLKDAYLGNSGEGLVTEILLTSGINPLYGLKEVPQSFLYGARKVKTLTIPSNIKRINEYAIVDCNIEEIIIEKGVEQIDSFAFYTLSNLTNLSLPDSLTLDIGNQIDLGLKSFTVPPHVVLSDTLFDSCALEYFSYKGTKNPLFIVLSNCSKLTTIEFQEGTDTLFEQWSHCPNVKNIICPRSATYIDDELKDKTFYVYPNCMCEKICKEKGYNYELRS